MQSDFPSNSDVINHRFNVNTVITFIPAESLENELNILKAVHEFYSDHPKMLKTNI